MRVPVATGSVVDLTVNLSKAATPEAINAAMKKAAEGPLKGILATPRTRSFRPTSSATRTASIFAGPWTTVIGDKMVKVVSWYDNEWGYSCRTVDLIEKIAKL